MTEQSVEKLRAQLFDNRFCFLLKNIPHEFEDWKMVPKPNKSFELFAIVVDFYIDANLLKLTKFVQIQIFI
jgi:hypothetical protein